MAKRYLIIGDGAAGTTAAQTIRQHDRSGQIEIYSDDPNPAYFRAALTNYLIGELREDQIWAVPPTFYTDFNVKRLLAQVTRVDTANNRVFLGQGKEPVPYDYLVLASGSRARPAPFEGNSLPGVMTMRTLQDVRQVMDLIKVHGLRRAVIAGGGPLAMEWVQGLHERGVQVTYILRGTRLMSRVLDKTASDLTLARMRLAGVDVRTEEEITAAVPGQDGQVTAVRLKSGETIPCQLVGVAFGVICNSEFLKGSDIQLSKRGGVLVNEKMQSSSAKVYAAGDVAEFEGTMLQLWEPARWQGRVAALNIAGVETRFKPGAHYNATRLFDLDFASVGEVMGETAAGVEEVVDFPQGRGRITYRKLFIRDGRLIGAIMVGQRQERVRQRGRTFKWLIESGKDIEAIKQKLLDPAFDINGWLDVPALVHKPQAVSGLPDISPATMMKSQILSPITGLQSLPSVAAGAAPVQSVQVSRPAAVLRPAEGGEAHRLSVLFRAGRSADNDLVLNDQFASGHHAEIRWDGKQYQLTDLNSSNGTFLDGRRLMGSAAVTNGTHIRFGHSDFILELSDVPAPISVVKAVPAARLTVAASQSDEKGQFLSSVGLGTQQLARPVQVQSEGPPPYLEGNGRRWELTQLVSGIGRDQENTVVIDDPAASHIHAHIQRQGQQLYLRDAGSRNGTWLNREQVTVPALLKNGDQIQIGRTVLVFHYKMPGT